MGIRCTIFCRACQPPRTFEARPLTAAPTRTESGGAAVSQFPCSGSHAGVSPPSLLSPLTPLSHAVATMTLESAREAELTGRSANAGSAD